MVRYLAAAYRSATLSQSTTPRSVRGSALAEMNESAVRDPLTDEILFGRLEHGGTVHVGFDGEKLTFEYDSAPPPDAPEIPPAAVLPKEKV